jgi:hypothetical protein
MWTNVVFLIDLPPRIETRAKATFLTVAQSYQLVADITSTAQT